MRHLATAVVAVLALAGCGGSSNVGEARTLDRAQAVAWLTGDGIAPAAANCMVDYWIEETSEGYAMWLADPDAERPPEPENIEAEFRDLELSMDAFGECQVGVDPE